MVASLPGGIAGLEHIAEFRGDWQTDGVIPGGTSEKTQINVDEIARLNLCDRLSLYRLDLAVCLLHRKDQGKQLRSLSELEQILAPCNLALLTICESNHELHGGADQRVSSVVKNLLDDVLIVVYARSLICVLT